MPARHSACNELTSHTIRDFQGEVQREVQGEAQGEVQGEVQGAAEVETQAEGGRAPDEREARAVRKPFCTVRYSSRFKNHYKGKCETDPRRARI